MLIVQPYVAGNFFSKKLYLRVIAAVKATWLSDLYTELRINIFFPPTDMCVEYILWSVTIPFDIILFYQMALILLCRGAFKVKQQFSHIKQMFRELVVPFTMPDKAQQDKSFILQGTIWLQVGTPSKKTFYIVLINLF